MALWRQAALPDQVPASAPLLHPLHAIFLAFPIALFAGALAADITYLNTAVIMWSNFAAWMITGALVFGGVALVWAIVVVLTRRASGLRGRARLFLVLLALMWFAGLINAFQHSRDGWSSVETTGLVLSIVSTVLALVAGWIGYSPVRAREIAR